jgi:hypothetical protein
MNDLIRALMECLGQEADCYRQLASAAEQQKELLMAGKVEALPENVRIEEKVVFALGPLKSHRNELLSRLAKAFGVKNLSLSEALQKIPLEWVEEFKKSILDLVQAAKNLDEINRTNEKLLTNALSYVNFSLKLIAGGGKKKAFSPSLTKEEEKAPAFVDRVV